MKKIYIRLILLFIGAIALFTLMKIARRADSQRFVIDPEQIELSDLSEEAVALTHQIDSLKEKREKQLTGSGQMSVIFTEPNERIYSEAYKMSNDIPFVVLISENDLPGSDGNLSWTQLSELIDAGWGLCLYWDGSTEPEVWDSNMRQLLADHHLDEVKSVYFPKNNFITALAAEFAALGYHTLVHHGENGLPTSCTSIDEAGLWLPGACGWSSQGSSSMPKNTAINGGSLTFTINYSQEDELYEEERWHGLMEVLTKYRNENGLVVGTLEGGYDHYAALAKANSTGTLYDADIASLQEQLDTVRKRIAEINASK